MSAATTWCWPSETLPVRLTVRSTSTTSPACGTGSGGGPAGRPPWRSSPARSATDRCERTVLIRAPAINRWITSGSAQNVTVTPERAGPSQNCLPATCKLPDGGTTRSNSTAAPDHCSTGGWGTTIGAGGTGGSVGAMSEAGSLTGTTAVSAARNRSAGNAMSRDWCGRCWLDFQYLTATTARRARPTTGGTRRRAKRQEPAVPRG